MQTGDDQETLLLSVDFEDWHQLVRRRVGVPDWERPGPALRRQTEAMLRLFDELGVRATFFILGMAARAHPDLVRVLAGGGHEIACHGDMHLPVHTQTPSEFAADLRAARATVEELTGRQPVGYRAPAFSITRETPWAHDVLAAEGFAYDASARGAPYPLELASGTLWELPVAVSRRGSRVRIPVGGASYWAVMPTKLVLEGLAASGPMAGLYLHPHELDPQPLDALLPRSATPAQRVHGAVRTAQRNLARQRAPEVLRAIAGRHRLIPYGEAHAELSGSAPARS
jgi:polysaccharide deacetylase family protein (PEP-CTERM system associated)